MATRDDGLDLLRSRLRASATVLALALGLFFARSFALEFAPLRYVQGSLCAALIGVVVLLWSARPLSLRWLRALEWFVFGGVTLFLAAYQYRSVEYRVGQGQWAELLGTIRSSVMYTMVVVMLYGMLIPNPWRRAARGVITMALAPLAVTIVLLATTPLLRAARGLALIEQVSDALLMLFLTTGMSIYGARLIHNLRREATEARRLDQYTLRRKLGSGGMGEVYLAEHLLLKRPCALKLIRPDHADDARALARFEREVQATARLSHPNTVEIYDYGRTKEGTFYYVMEYLRGLSLDELVARHGPLPCGRVIHLLRQVCDALAEAHAAGLLHRDLKPDNLFAARRGGHHDVVKILDFGLARDVGEDPQGPEYGQESAVTGSPSYMSPEQATGARNIDPRSDLYALGAVGYFLLTGRPPFVGPTAIGVMVAHARDPVEPPSAHRPGITADLEAVILRLLSKKPAARYADATAVDAALAACGAADEWDAARADAWWRSFETNPPGESGTYDPSPSSRTKPRPAPA